MFDYLDLVEDLLWAYLGVPLVIFLGMYLTIASNFVQIRKFPIVVKTFTSLLFSQEKSAEGVSPMKAFFASVGGCIGVGNIVGICSAVQIGGPGALFWIWVTAIWGMLIKYSEVYLGVRFRVKNKQGGYDGGPMYFIPKAFKNRWVPGLVAVLLCIYGVEVYQFRIITTAITENSPFSELYVVPILLALVIFSSSGGVSRVGAISSAIIPFFVVIYVAMGSWVLFNNLTELPRVIGEVFSYAFSSHAIIGGTFGVALMKTVSQGVRRGCYTGDLGIGYASVIHSESSVKIPEKQAALVVFDIFIDTFIICTTSIALILVTDVWKLPISTAMLVQTSLGYYFPYMEFFMPFFLFLLGYSTINAYFCVGIKCAEYLSPNYGRSVYFAYAIASLLLCSFYFDAYQAQSVMAVAGCLLLLINGCAIFALRKEISFDWDYPIEEPKKDPLIAEA